MAAADQVVPGDPAFHCPVVPGGRGGVHRCFGMVCNSHHRGLSALSVRLRRGCVPLVVQGCGVCVSAHHRSLSTVPPVPLNGSKPTAPTELCSTGLTGTSASLQPERIRIGN